MRSFLGAHSAHVDMETGPHQALGNISAHAPFCAPDVRSDGDLTQGFLRHEEFLAQGHFSTWMFWRLANQYGHFGTISVPVLLCQDVHVPKSPCAEMFLGRKLLTPKIPLAKKSLCRNVPVLKSLSAGMSAVTNSAHAKMFPDETSVPK